MALSKIHLGEARSPGVHRVRSLPRSLRWPFRQRMTTPAEAKTPGKTYCFVGNCHRVKTIEETQALVGVEESITASHYDDCSKDRYNPCGLTSSGERFHPDRPGQHREPDLSRRDARCSCGARRTSARSSCA